jgi:hypothetical protein
MKYSERVRQLAETMARYNDEGYDLYPPHERSAIANIYMGVAKAVMPILKEEFIKGHRSGMSMVNRANAGKKYEHLTLKKKIKQRGLINPYFVGLGPYSSNIDCVLPLL